MSLAEQLKGVQDAALKRLLRAADKMVATRGCADPDCCVAAEAEQRAREELEEALADARRWLP